jgi:hypothetical protein
VLIILQPNQTTHHIKLFNHGGEALQTIELNQCSRTGLVWVLTALSAAHDKGTNNCQPKKNHYRKNKTDNDCDECPIKPSANHAGLLLLVSRRHNALPPMMKASMIPIVITATTGKMMQKMTNIANHQSFPIAISSTHLP